MISRNLFCSHSKVRVVLFGYRGISGSGSGFGWRGRHFPVLYSRRMSWKCWNIYPESPRNEARVLMIGTCSTQSTMKSKDQTRSQKPRGDAVPELQWQTRKSQGVHVFLLLTHSTLCQTIRLIEHVCSSTNRELFDISIRFDWFDSNNYFSTVKHNRLRVIRVARLHCCCQHLRNYQSHLM